MKENKSFNERERVSFEIPWKEREGGAWENRGKFSNVREGIRVAGNRGESMCPGEIELYTVKTRVVYRQTTGATIEIPKWWVVLHAYFRSSIRKKEILREEIVYPRKSYEKRADKNSIL